MMPHHANGLHPPSVFGGIIMSMVDRASAVAAMKHCAGPVTTLSIDRIVFKEPIRIGELVEVHARVVFVGRTSMAIMADVFAEGLLTGTRRHTNECWLTFVALDEHGHAAPVPPIRPETKEDVARHEIAARRRRQALAERSEEDGGSARSP
jgi:acyl-CoA hydrolase